MKFTKAAITALILLLMMTGSGQASVTLDGYMGGDVLTINVSVNQPTCSISAPNSYELGSLTQGRKEHDPLIITWSCDTSDPSLKTALTASIVSGIRDGDSSVYLLTGQEKSTAKLSLKKGNDLIKLLEQGVMPGEDDYFCNDTGIARTCSLIPVTEVSSGGTSGQVSATLSFEVVYP